MKVVAAAVVVAASVVCAPVARAITGDEMCKAMHWPMPLPSMVGYPLDHMDNDTILSCLDFTATAPDGHDAMNDPALQAHTWKVTGQSPPAGTMVPQTQKVVLTVVRDYNQP
jgi:hypothetical protein